MRRTNHCIDFNKVGCCVVNSLKTLNKYSRRIGFYDDCKQQSIKDDFYKKKRKQYLKEGILHNNSIQKLDIIATLALFICNLKVYVFNIIKQYMTFLIYCRLK